MTPLEWLLTALASLLGVGGLAFAYVLHLANAMKTTAPPMPARSTALALTPPVATGILVLVVWWMAREHGHRHRALAWNAPGLLGASLTVVMSVGAWLGSRPAARRRAAERRARREDDAMREIWQRSGRRADFDLQVERGIPTSVTLADGTSRPATDWIVRFVAEQRPQSIHVVSFAPTAASIPIERQAQGVLGELAQRLAAGWRPDPAATRPLEITLAES
jgi:hypothetical protein